MARLIRIAAFLFVVICLLFFYYKPFQKRHHQKVSESLSELNPFKAKTTSQPPAIALIFDDLGENLTDIKKLYALATPLTVSIIPDLRYSKNISHIAARNGFSVMIHLPLEPKEKEYLKAPYAFIGAGASRGQLNALLQKYLEAIPVAKGVNNHMGSKATEDPEFMHIVLRAIKEKNLFFVDSKTSSDSVACQVADEEGLRCVSNEWFLDAVEGEDAMLKRMDDIIARAKQNGKTIVIAHPRKSTITFLAKHLPDFRERADFITIEQYLER